MSQKLLLMMFIERQPPDEEYCYKVRIERALYPIGLEPENQFIEESGCYLFYPDEISYNEALENFLEVQKIQIDNKILLLQNMKHELEKFINIEKKRDVDLLSLNR